MRYWEIDEALIILACGVVNSSASRGGTRKSRRPVLFETSYGGLGACS
jgi:hypothetical protein